MYTLFVILIVLAALLMIGIVLIQESKGGGLASNFSSSNQIMGVRKTTDVIEKTTWGLAVAMVVLSVICAYVAPDGSRKWQRDRKGGHRTAADQPEQPARIWREPDKTGCSGTVRRCGAKVGSAGTENTCKIRDAIKNTGFVWQFQINPVPLHSLCNTKQYF